MGAGGRATLAGWSNRAMAMQLGLYGVPLRWAGLWVRVFGLLKGHPGSWGVAAAWRPVELHSWQAAQMSRDLLNHQQVYRSWRAPPRPGPRCAQGYCRHGDSCTFAHGMHELPRHRRDAILADEGAYRGPPGGHPEPEVCPLSACAPPCLLSALCLLFARCCCIPRARYLWCYLWVHFCGEELPSE